MTVVDLTHPISPEVRVYFPWHPETRLDQTANFSEHRCMVHRLSIGTHTGTHIDAPAHVFEKASTIDQYSPSVWYVDAQVIDFTPREPSFEISRKDLESKGVKEGVGVILKTGWDKFFGSEEYYKTYPALTDEAARYLVERRTIILAADTPFKLDVHYTLLREQIPLVTNINNTRLLKEGLVKLISAPLLIKDGDGSPARVFAVVEE